MNPSSTSLRNAMWLAVLVLAVLTLTSFATRPLTPIDETRYIGVAWEMWLNDNFLVPFKNGAAYSHKPPMLFWTMHAGWALFGVNDWWPRLIMPLFSVASLLLTAGLARRLWPERPEVAVTAVLVLAGSLYWALFSTTVMFDVMLACWTLVGMHGVLDAAAGRRRGVFLIGLAIGLGILTKGPVIMLHILPAAVLAFWWNPGLRWRSWFGGLLVSVLVGAAIALAWAIPAGYAGGEAYRNAIFWGQTADRMVNSFAHRRGWYWYLPLLPVMLFPWLVWPRLWSALRELWRDGLDRGVRFCLAWMLPVFVAFSLISGKQPHYLLPFFPAFALLAGRALPEAALRAGVALPALLAALIGAVLLATGAGLAPSLARRLPEVPQAWPGALLIGVALLTWWWARRGRAVSALLLLGGATLAAMQFSVVAVMHPAYDVGPMARAVRAVQDEGHPVANAATYHDQYQFAGRLTQPLKEAIGSDLMAWLAAHPEGYAVLYLRDPLPADAQARFVQPYRSRIAALVDAKTAARLLGGGEVQIDSAPVQDEAD